MAKKQTTTQKKTIVNKKSKASLKKKPTILQHAVSSLISVAPHSHTGKRAPHRHTSHGFLLLALIFTGVLLFSNLGVLRAYAETHSIPGSVTVTTSYYGTAPTEGANITFPTTNRTTTHKFIFVIGTCPDQTLVAVYNNGNFAGSTVCDTGKFYVIIQLAEGTNVIQAQNYDGMNQPGPTTAQIVVSYVKPVVAATTLSDPVKDAATTDAQVPANPTPITPTPTCRASYISGLCTTKYLRRSNTDPTIVY